MHKYRYKWDTYPEICDLLTFKDCLIRANDKFASHVDYKLYAFEIQSLSHRQKYEPHKRSNDLDDVFTDIFHEFPEMVSNFRCPFLTEHTTCRNLGLITQSDIALVPALTPDFTWYDTRTSNDLYRPFIGPACQYKDGRVFCVIGRGSEFLDKHLFYKQKPKRGLFMIDLADVVLVKLIVSFEIDKGCFTREQAINQYKDLFMIYRESYLKAAKMISSSWKKAFWNPHHPVGRRRLLKEFCKMTEDEKLS